MHKACKMYGERNSRGNVVFVVKTHKQREFEGVFFVSSQDPQTIYFTQVCMHRRRCDVTNMSCVRFEVSHFSNTVTEVCALKRRGHFYIAHLH